MQVQVEERGILIPDKRREDEIAEQLMKDAEALNANMWIPYVLFDRKAAIEAFLRIKKNLAELGI
jgi:hypothetical protein